MESVRYWVPDLDTAHQDRAADLLQYVLEPLAKLPVAADARTLAVSGDAAPYTAGRVAHGRPVHLPGAAGDRWSAHDRAILVGALAVLGGSAATVGVLVCPALAGAAFAAVAVLSLSSTGRGPATPVPMTLAGVALTAVFGGVTTAVRWGEDNMSGTLLTPLGFTWSEQENATVADEAEPEAVVSNERLGSVVGDAAVLFVDSNLRGEVNAFMADLLQATTLYQELPAVRNGRDYLAGKNTVAGYTDANHTLDRVEEALQGMRED